ncbi:MAG: hypothetical protein KAU20_05855 [Nanoarchaeota archaeon]|nr:hypothetical protein [Nanoarchaeota archaeon]
MMGDTVVIDGLKYELVPDDKTGRMITKLIHAGENLNKICDDKLEKQSGNKRTS